MGLCAKLKGLSLPSLDLKKQELRRMALDFKKLDDYLPHMPQTQVKGLVSSECSIFASAVQPVKLVFATSNGGKEALIVKNGDDMRQDALVLQMIRLMDQMLKDVGHDFHFTAYKVLACSTNDGWMEFVPSTTLQKVLDDSGRNIR